MYVLARKPEETVVIGDDIVVKVIRTGRNRVSLGFEAPNTVRIRKGEEVTMQVEIIQRRLPIGHVKVWAVMVQRHDWSGKMHILTVRKAAASRDDRLTIQVINPELHDSLSHREYEYMMGKIKAECV